MPEATVTIRKWINPMVLRWARERMGLQPQQVEDLSKDQDIEIEAKDLIAWENDQAEPELSELEVLAAIYACPVGYFTLDSPPQEKMPLNYRGLVSNKIQTLSYESRLQLRRFVSLTEYLTLVTGQLNLHASDISQYSISDTIQTIADKERQRLGITLAARADLGFAQNLFEICRRKLESLGIFVLSLKINPREVRGASRWDQSGPPSILVNDTDAEAAAGRIFTLLHEYAHLLIRQPGFICDFRGQDERTEVFCNKFAAEVLVPKDEFKQYLAGEGLLQKRDWWSDSLLDRIRRPFLASRDVIVILLEEISLAPAGFYANKARIWDSQRVFFRRSKLGSGHRRTKIQLMRNKLGEAFTSAIVTGYGQGIVSSFDLAELLDTRIEKVDEFILWARES